MISDSLWFSVAALLYGQGAAMMYIIVRHHRDDGVFNLILGCTLVVLWFLYPILLPTIRFLSRK